MPSFKELRFSIKYSQIVFNIINAFNKGLDVRILTLSNQKFIIFFLFGKIIL
jgi:hypothetical protein